MVLGRTFRFLKLSGGNFPCAATRPPGAPSATITSPAITPTRRIGPPGVTCDGVMISPAVRLVPWRCEQLVRNAARRVTFNLLTSYAVLPLDSHARRP